MFADVCSMSPCPRAFQVAQPLQSLPLTGLPPAVSVRVSNLNEPFDSSALDYFDLTNGL